MTTHHVVLCLGSNSADRHQQMGSAIEWICSQLGDVERSSTYETISDNGIGAPYLNTVIAGTTDMEIHTFTTLVKNKEAQCGRTPGSKLNGDISIDIDIIIWDGIPVRPQELGKTYFQQGYNEIRPKTGQRTGAVGEEGII